MTAFVTARLVVLLLPAQLLAQRPATLSGTVTAADRTPLERAQVTVAGTSLVAAAGTDGGFRFAGVPPGNRTISVRMLGYTPISMPVEVLAGESLHLELVLTATPLPLETVEVSADPVVIPAVTPAMRGFAERRARGPGRFITREEILRMQPRVFTDILRRIPGLHVRPTAGAHGNNVSVQTRGGGCQVLFYLNGTAFPVPPEFPVNHFIAPEEVIAVEVYSGSSVPAEFNSSLSAKCGVILVWTRHGPESPRRR